MCIATNTITPGELVATSAEVWEAVVIPEVLSDYTEKKRNELKKTIQHSFVVGFDYYKYSKKTWTCLGKFNALSL